MARVLKNRFPFHRMTIEADGNAGQFLFVGSGQKSYFWAGCITSDSNVATISGAATLRKLAYAILKEVGK